VVVSGHDVTLEEIKTLSLREKLPIMDAIGTDLREHAERLDIPQSHKDLLDTRRERVATGKAALDDWDEVKDAIGRR
jgi:hypothetical protein